MARRRSSRIVLIALIAAVALTSPARAGGGPSGNISYGYQEAPYVYDIDYGNLGTGTAVGHVSASATFRGCAKQGPCSWSAWVSAHRGHCFASPYTDPYPTMIWSSGSQTRNGKVSSGERQYNMGTPNELELKWNCVYVATIGPAPGYVETDYLVAEHQIDIGKPGQVNFASGVQSITGSGDLIVAFTQTGAGKRPVTYNLTAHGDDDWTCDGAYWGSVGWGGPGWSTPVTLTPDKGGRVSGSLTMLAEPGTSLSPCLGTIERAWIKYTNILVTASNGTTLSTGTVSQGTKPY